MQPLPVQSDPAGRPLALLWEGSFLQVDGIIDSWDWAGDWVHDVSERRYWLVSLRGGLLLEICEELDTGLWLLSRIQD